MAIACLGLVVVQVAVLWSETGGGVLTRYFDPQRAVMERVSRDIAAFGRDDDEFWEKDPNRFRLGLLPAGTDKHVVSVLTLVTPLLVAMVLLLVDRRRDSGGKG